MFSLMKRSKRNLVWAAAGALLIGSGVGAWADTSGNKYEMIVERNPFGLKPPPPPPDPSELNKPPPTPPATVELTGITSILSSKRALFEIIPGPGKPMIKPILAEGERIESVEVVSINVDKNEVTVKNGGLITNLTFKVAKSGPTPAAAVPGSIPPPVIPGAAPAVPTQSSYNQNQGSGRYNVMVGGGNATVAPSSGAPASGTPAYSGAGVNPAIVNDGGFRSIPSRNLRTGITPAQGIPQGAAALQGQEAALSRDEQYRQMEENRLKNAAINQLSGQQVLPPLPPTPYTPPDAPGYIPPPRPPGFPPLPGR
jgi:hypothetical protein